MQQVKYNVYIYIYIIYLCNNKNIYIYHLETNESIDYKWKNKKLYMTFSWDCDDGLIKLNILVLYIFILYFKHNIKLFNFDIKMQKAFKIDSK